MIGSQLRQARLAAGLTQDEVVERLAKIGCVITKQGLSKYELGKSTPKAAFVLKAAQALGVKSSYLLHEPTIEIEWLAFRKQATLTERRQDQIKAHVQTIAEAHVELRGMLTPDEQVHFPTRRVVTSLEDAEAAADELRRLWNLGIDPIESVVQVAEDRGAIVVEQAETGVTFDGLSGYATWFIPIAVINSTVPRDRKRFDLAHELGHLVMNTDGLPDAEAERRAHRFAGAFLVPAETARRELGAKRRQLSLDELSLLKLKHGLSMQAWIYRALDLDIITKPLYSRLFAKLTAMGARKQEPVQLDGTEEPVRLKQMTLRAFSERLITEGKALELCPGCVTPQPASRAPGQRYTARDLMKLPREERNRILALASLEAEEEYRTNPELTEFNALDGEDWEEWDPDDE